MKRVFSFILILFILAFSSVTYASAEPTISAKSAVVMNGLTRDVLYSKNSEKKMSMASTTKIMTSLLLIESGNLDEVVTISKYAAGIEGSSIGLRAGDKVTKRTLLLGMMLESGNDAATAAAEAVSGSLEDFALLMNKRAAEIGMKNSSFVTPSGLDAETHYTTAYDMALLTATALENKEFREVSSIVKTEVEIGGKKHTFTNHHRLLTEYEGCIGVKTGYTRKSGRCLVTAAKRNACLIITVTLNDSNDWEDHKEMLDYGFKNTDTVDITYSDEKPELSVVGSNVSLVELAIPTRQAGIDNQNKKYITAELTVDRFVYAPIAAGQTVGKVKYFYKDILIAEDSVYVGGDIEYSNIQFTDADRFWKNFRLLFSFYK